MLKRKSAAIAAAATLLVGFTGYGLAQAAIPNSATGEFTACVANYTGTVKIIDKESGSTCGYGYVEKTWNQAGQPGPQGAPGPQGPAGPAAVANPVFLHVVEGSFPYGMANESRWAECPTGSVIASAAGTLNSWQMFPRDWNVQATPQQQLISFWEYSETGAHFKVGYPNQGPSYDPPPGPFTYKITLKCQGV